MKIYKLLRIMEDRQVLSKSYLEKQLSISQSSLRNIKSEANKIGKYNGFYIITIRSEGYQLVVNDEEKFKSFLRKENPLFEGYDSGNRIDLILYIILQTNDYITYDYLATTLCVSKATIIRDFKIVEEKLNKHNVFLEKRSGYGIKILGDEKNIRKAFSYYVLSNSAYTKPVKGYVDFTKEINIKELTDRFSELLRDKNLEVSDVALKNIVEHITILIYRAKQDNFINNFESHQVDEVFINIAKDLIEWVNERYQLQINEAEIDLLAAHISGKTISDMMITKNQDNLREGIIEILREIDNEFLADTQNDELLIDALIIHVFPLINRIYNNLQLTNPLIDEVYSEYANVFLVALRFSTLIENKYNFVLSKDEVGYIALHFAAHFERLKNKRKERYKKIVAICGTGGGSAQLLKIKIESIFPKAHVSTKSTNELEKIEFNKYDLVLTTMPLEIDFEGVPSIFIKEWLDDNEIRRIEKIIMMRAKEDEQLKPIKNVLSLFFEDLFYVNGIKEYKEMLYMMADDAVKKGYADDEFPDSVLQRENRFATIYKNGVAGPHPMTFAAKKDSISVAVFDKPFIWENREVRIIFLMNFKKGNLFVHREISNILLRLIEDEKLLDAVAKCRTFKQFQNEIKTIIS